MIFIIYHYIIPAVSHSKKSTFIYFHFCMQSQWLWSARILQHHPCNKNSNTRPNLKSLAQVIGDVILALTWLLGSPLSISFTNSQCFLSSNGAFLEMIKIIRWLANEVGRHLSIKKWISTAFMPGHRCLLFGTDFLRCEMMSWHLQDTPLICRKRKIQVSRIQGAPIMCLLGKGYLTTVSGLSGLLWLDKVRLSTTYLSHPISH